MFRRVLSKRNRVLIKELVKTDFKLKYQGSVLGVAWSALKPLFLFVVMYFVFVEFMRISDPAIENYALVLLCGIAVWDFLARRHRWEWFRLLRAVIFCEKSVFPSILS